MTLNNRTIGWLLGAAAGLYLLLQLLPVLTPFLVAALLAYLMDPLVGKLEKRGLGRSWAVALIFVVLGLLLTLLLLLVVPMLFRQLVSFVHNLPEYLAVMQAWLLPQLQRFDIHVEVVPLDEVRRLLQENWQQAGGFLTEVLKRASASTLTLVAFFANLTLVPVVAFYLMRDWRKLLCFLRESLPTQWRNKVLGILGECDEVLSAFIRGQLLVMLSLAGIYSVGLGVVGLDLALFLGTLAGLASVVPYLGAIVGIAASTIVAYVQFQELLPLVWVCLVFGIGQMLEGMLLTPMLVGDKIGLHPVAVIFAIMAGGQLAGFVGVLLALPVAAVLMVFVRHFHRQYKASQLFMAVDDHVE